MASEEIFFEQIRSSGCLSYILGCKQDHVCVVIDPEIDKADDYVELARFFGSTVLYAIDTHTHADHNSACKVMRERYGTQVVMHRATEAALRGPESRRRRRDQFRQTVAHSRLHAGSHPGCHVPCLETESLPATRF